MIAIGTILHDTYRLEAELGRGGMGCVYAASHMRLPRRVAVKVLTETTDAQALKRFRREAEICSQIGHSNIVEVFDFNEHEQQPYIVMELLTGESLRQRLHREPVMPRPLLLQMLREIGKALAAAHAVGVVHRDLKPANLFLCREDGGERFKILDFGISKIMGQRSLQTREDSLLGTPGYMSPEQARGDVHEVTAYTDQFAFASIVYEALSGHAAFVSPEDTPYTVLYKIVHKEPAPLFGASASLRAALARALSKEPRQRFDNVDAMIAALLAALAEPATAPRRGSWRGPALALGLGVAGVGATLLARQLRHRDPTLAPPSNAPLAPPSNAPLAPPSNAPLAPSLPPSSVVPAPAGETQPAGERPDAGAPRAKRHGGAHHPQVTTPVEDELSNPYEAKP